MQLKLAAVQAKLASHRNLLYVRTQKVGALLTSGGVRRKILFSEKPDWADAIRGGFQRLPHQIDFGSITEDSFQHYDIVVPLTIAAIEQARRLSIKQQFGLPLPTAASVRLCDDKYAFSQALIGAGFDKYIPTIHLGPGLTSPYILKKRRGWWGAGCYIIANREDEEAQLHRIADPEYFCQEFIPGTTEFATHILFIKGKIVKALNIKYRFATESPIKGQDTELFKVVHRCPYLNLFAQMLQAIQFEGLCCVNYKVAKGRLFLLEINPRFGGSLAPYFFSFVNRLPGRSV